MGQIQEVKTQIIGVNVWWDHKLQEYRSKRINLEKASLKFRCPNCGKIIIKLRDRDSMFLGLLLRFSLIGGVCRACYYDGFGTLGTIGKELDNENKEREKKYKLLESERITKYGKEPKYWLNLGFTKNPEWGEWNQRRFTIDDDEKRRKNAKLVEVFQ